MVAPSTSQNNRFMQGAMPKAYRSMSSEKADKSFEEVESIKVPALPETAAKITFGSSDFESDDEVKDEKVAESNPDVVPPKNEERLKAAALPNESSSFGDEFESCNEGDESANVEAVNPSLLILSNDLSQSNQRVLNESKNDESIFATPDPDQPPPPDNPPPPLATSSPYASMEQQIDFIDRLGLGFKIYFFIYHLFTFTNHLFTFTARTSQSQQLQKWKSPSQNQSPSCSATPR